MIAYFWCVLSICLFVSFVCNRGRLQMLVVTKINRVDALFPLLLNAAAICDMCSSKASWLHYLHLLPSRSHALIQLLRARAQSARSTGSGCQTFTFLFPCCSKVY